MSTFAYRTASDHTLHVRHFRRRNGSAVMDADAMAICTGVPADELTTRIKVKAGPVITSDEIDRGRARTDITRIKLGREPSVFDVLREFGDESAASGLLTDDGTMPRER